MDETAQQIADIAINDLNGLPPGVGLLIVLMCVVIVAQAWFILSQRKEIREERNYQRELIAQGQENNTETLRTEASLTTAFEGMKTEFLRLQSLINSRSGP